MWIVLFIIVFVICCPIHLSTIKSTSSFIKFAAAIVENIIKKTMNHLAKALLGTIRFPYPTVVDVAMAKYMASVNVLMCSKQESFEM